MDIKGMNDFIGGFKCSLYRNTSDDVSTGTPEFLAGWRKGREALKEQKMHTLLSTVVKPITFGDVHRYYEEYLNGSTKRG